MESYLGCDPYNMSMLQQFSYWSNGALHFRLRYNIYGQVHGVVKTFSSKGYITSVVKYEDGFAEGEKIRIN